MDLDRIELSVDIKAPVGRVWRALTDHREFGAWFRAELSRPFVLGEESSGRMTIPGVEHISWSLRVTGEEPGRLFSFTWPAYLDGVDLDFNSLPWLAAEFRLLATLTGTRVTVVESGFSLLPENIGLRVRSGNEEGWKFQLLNLLHHAESSLAG